MPASCVAAATDPGWRNAERVSSDLGFARAIHFSLPKTTGQTISAGMEFSQVTAVAKANVYFDGKVVSHSIRFEDGSRKTLGVIYPGSYHFNTEAAERMEITDGACAVVLDGHKESVRYEAGSHFDVPARSGFTITVSGPLCQYVCSFLT